MSAYPVTYNEDGSPDTMKLYSTRKDINKAKGYYEKHGGYQYAECPEYQYEDLIGSSSKDKEKNKDKKHKESSSKHKSKKEEKVSSSRNCPISNSSGIQMPS
ncbi:hypothetical protein F5Y19DRAFT_481392 [Xylariaceae sp. FL1651]|nr:hypothetical protein F5Y19DRAFT_481392 [Xylariaceae sp. FL1651]